MRDLVVGLFATASLLSVAVLWEHPVILAVIVMCLGLGFIWKSSSPHAAVLYVLFGVLGAASEVVAIAFGGWSYAKPLFLGIPPWLPFLWGNAGLFFLAAAQKLEEVWRK